MRLIVVSGLSGSGKSVALHMLEDVGYYCIDNIPAAMLKPFIAHTVHSGTAQYERTAVGLDARNEPAEIATVPKLIDDLKESGVQCEVVFLLASDEDLLRRFAETRRKHPMSSQETSLKEAIAMERRLLEPIIYAADLVVDTSKMGVHDLRELIAKRVEQRSIMRDDHACPAKPPQRVDDERARRAVEVVGRLVEQQHIGGRPQRGAELPAPPFPRREGLPPFKRVVGQREPRAPAERGPVPLR